MTQREAFEAWAKSWSLDTDHKEKDAWGREQYSPHIHSMWQGWQAAQAQAADLRGVSDAQGLHSLATPAHTTGESSGHPTTQAAVEPVAIVAGQLHGDHRWLLAHGANVAKGDKLYTSPPSNQDAMRMALERMESFALWADSQADAQSKGGHATFDIMELREQRDMTKAAIAALEKGCK